MSLQILTNLGTGGVIVPTTEGDPLVRNGEREGSILLASEPITITHARYAAGQQVAGPHIHHEHTDAFYVLEGELTFEIGREAKTITVAAGGFLAAPPGVAHSFRTDGDRPARWLTIHAHDGGFAAFMRGLRDGVTVEWDISPVPADGGLPASHATVSHDLPGADRAAESPPSRLRCALPDLHVAEWHLHGPHLNLPFQHRYRGVDSFFVIEGELDALLAGTTHTVRQETLISVPHGVQYAINYRGPNHTRVLSLHTPDRLLADNLRLRSETRRNPVS
jgi:mannose-6-phosphate isomerase-like protein (cupin superfamily)